MLQVFDPVLAHIVLESEPVFAGLARYASLRQPTRVSPAQRPAPFGQTQVFVPPGPPVGPRLP